MKLTVLFFLFFNKEPGQSDGIRKRKWACWVYHTVLTLLAASSFVMSSYSQYRWTTNKTNGSTRGNPFTRSHEVIQDTSYRMGNPVSMSNDGLLLLNPSNGNVHCNGSFSGGGSKFPFLVCFLSFFYEATWK